MEQATRRDVEERVLAALPDWVNTVNQINRLIADRLGVGASDLDCLHVLRSQSPITAAELARHMGLTPGSVSRMLDRLDAAGFIVRTADPDNRRRVLVEADDEGLARVAVHYEGLAARCRDDLAAFRGTDLDTLLRFIERSHHSADEELTRLRLERP